MTHRRVRLVALALLVTLAGCGVVSTPGTDGATTEAGPGGSIPPVMAEVSVTAVVDGDTIRVTYPNGSTDTVRLVGIDTPEVHVENDPTEFEGVPDTEAGRACLREAGTEASNFATDELLGREVGLALDPETDRRDRYERLLAYVVADDRLFNYRLVAAGHARVYDSRFSQAERFYEAEAAATADGRGLWQCVDPADRETATAAESGLAIATIHADAAGNDNENLNDEYVVFENHGDAPLALDGWTVSDEAGQTYTFGALTLDPGQRVTLHTGAGTDTERDRYWGRTGAVWNNGGDTVTVRDENGALVAERSYD